MRFDSDNLHRSRKIARSVASDRRRHLRSLIAYIRALSAEIDEADDKCLNVDRKVEELHKAVADFHKTWPLYRADVARCRLWDSRAVLFTRFMADYHTAPKSVAIGGMR